MKERQWNKREEPISERLRVDSELQLIVDNNSMIYHKPTQQTALIMDVWHVEPIYGDDSTLEEDVYVRYTTDSGPKEDFSVDLDDEGWLWYDELTQELK